VVLAHELVEKQLGIMRRVEARDVDHKACGAIGGYERKR
jgi:hypothetical protein